MMSVNAFATLLEAFFQCFFVDTHTHRHTQTHTHTHTDTKAMLYPCCACACRVMIVQLLNIAHPQSNTKLSMDDTGHNDVVRILPIVLSPNSDNILTDLCY